MLTIMMLHAVSFLIRKYLTNFLVQSYNNKIHTNRAQWLRFAQ